MSELSDDTPAFGALWFGYNSPGYFLYARVLPNRRIFAQAELKFLRFSEAQAAHAIREVWLSKEWPKPKLIYASPTLWDDHEHDSGVKVESIAHVFARAKLELTRSHGEPMHGWQRVQDYLRDAPDGRPWFIASPACRVLARTLPSLVQTKTNPEELEGPDYAAQALRLLVQGRPSPSTAGPLPTKYPWGTVGWLKGLDRPAKGLLSRS